MKCPITECILSSDCGFLDITNKIPISKKTCSYFRTDNHRSGSVDDTTTKPPKTSFTRRVTTK